MTLEIEVMPGGYKDEAYSGHVALTGLSAALRSLGYRLQRYERGPRGQSRPIINLRLRNAPANLVHLDVPVQLAITPYHSQSALNAYVSLGGLRASLDGQFGLPAGDELGVRAFIPNLDGDYLVPPDAEEPAIAGVVDQRPRALVMRAIRARRGAKPFRDGQLDRFNARCAVSGCRTVDVLEAAHLRPYRTERDNELPNGVLLRADLHTLFDLDLIAIHPDAHTVAVHANVHDDLYRALHGRPVHFPVGGFDPAALLQRWELFRTRDG